jgi:glycosyltransferase involved in cell wall biosynthesis
MKKIDNNSEFDLKNKYDIILPVYGRLEYLPAAIESVIAQSFPDWHLIVINDAYPLQNGIDETQEIVESYQHPQISYLRNAQNLGIIPNFRYSFTLVQSDWFTVLGSDDILGPDYLKNLNEAASLFPSASFYQPNVQILNANGEIFLPLADRVKKISRDHYLSKIRQNSPNTNKSASATPSQKPSDLKEIFLGEGPELLRSLYSGYWLYFPTIAWKKESIERTCGFFSRNDSYSADAAMVFALLRAGEKLIIDSRESAFYRRHLASGSSAEKMNGTRFQHEAELFHSEARACRSLGWNKAARSADLMITTRLNWLAGKLRLQ